MALKKRAYIALILLTVAALVALKSPNNKYFEIARNLDIFATLFKEVNAYYVDEINPDELISTGIQAMLESLDPYTSYIPEEQLEDYRTMTTGLYGGIGATVGSIKDRTVITMLYKGYGADKAGMKIGDEIIDIDGVSLGGKDTGDATNLLKGQPGTLVSIKVRRNGEEVKSFNFERETIRIDNVPYYENITDQIGYIRLSDFTLGASREVEQALKELKKNGAEKVIMDLRSNPGGLLSEAINISNIFIPRGKDVVSTRGKVEEWNKTYKALNQPIDKEMPLVVLTNNMSASASEIVAGVIQDYDRGVLIGRRTFGKGLVQATRPLSYNAQLKVTTAKYYIPSGRCIQAIDYAERNSEGAVSNIPDSLKVAFKTKSGRTVYDGGGLEPDISIEGSDLSAIAVELLKSGHIFDYATDYYYRHDQIDEAMTFELTDQEYESFSHWLRNKNFTYHSSLERSINHFMATAKENESSQRVVDKVLEVRDRIAEVKKEDLNKHKDEIKKLLQQEIVSRYYLYEGDIQSALKGDRDLTAAIELLSNRDKYDKVLSK